MKKHYPVYSSNQKNPESQIVFKSLSNKNKTAVLKFMDEFKVNSNSHKRIDNCQRGLIRFLDFVEKDFDKIDYDDFVATAQAISKSKLGTYTRNGDRNFIKRFLQKNHPDWRTKFDDMKIMKGETKTEENQLSPEDLITEAELEKMISSTPNMKYKALIVLLYESGSRPEEILKLRWSDLDLSKKMIYLFSGKTGKKRGVPINNAINHLKRLKSESNPKEEAYIFSSNVNEQNKLSNAGLNYVLQQICKKAKLKKKVNSYTFRHTRLSELITKLSPKVYEDVAGHSLKMGMKTYAHLREDEHIKEMNEKVFKIEELTEDEKNRFERDLLEHRKEIDELKQILRDFGIQRTIIEMKKSIGKKGDIISKKDLNGGKVIDIEHF